MAFSALLDGERVLAPLMTDEQWARAKDVSKAQEERLLVNYSKLPGFARTSSLGVRHFAHRKGYAPDYEWSESAEHQALKAELVRAIAARGWQVDAEVPSGPERSWIADVLAEQGDQRIAFEVQWSKQSAVEYVRRTQRYADAGIECVWLMRHLPKLEGPDVSAEVKDAFSRVVAFQLHDTENLSRMIAAQDQNYRLAMLADAPTVSRGIATGTRILPIEQLTGAVLDGQLRVKRTFSAIVYIAACHRCRRDATYWYVPTLTRSRKLPRAEADGELFSEVLVASAVLDPDVPLAKVEARGAGSNVELCCPHCDAVQGWASEMANIAKAQRAKRGLRFEVPVGERWLRFVERYEPRTTTQAKLGD